MRGSGLVLLTLLPLLSMHVAAGSDDFSLSDTLGITGSMRTAAFSSSRTLDDDGGRGVASLWLKSSSDFSDSVGATVEGWLRREASSGGATSDAQFREGYLLFRSSRTDFKVGKQIIAWGRADKINPTDNLTPRDYTLLVAQDEDQRTGVLGANLAYYVGDYTLSLIWLPQFIPNVIPVALPPQIDVSEYAPNAPQGALKIDRSSSAIDWSVSYFNGINLNPDMEVALSDPSRPKLRLVHGRIQVFGFDAATSVGRYGYRAEFAYLRSHSQSSSLVFTNDSKFSGVVGVERAFSDDLDLNVQYYFEYMIDYENPESHEPSALRDLAVQFAAISNQKHRYQDGMSVRLSDKWWNETLTAELAAVVSYSGDGYVLRPKIGYSILDSLKLTVGIDCYRGDSNTFWGRLHKDSLGYAELKFSF